MTTNNKTMENQWTQLNQKVLNLIHTFFQTYGDNPYELEIKQVHVITDFITQELALAKEELVRSVREEIKNNKSKNASISEYYSGYNHAISDILDLPTLSINNEENNAR